MKRVPCVLASLSAMIALLPASAQPAADPAISLPTVPAVLELILPAGATATVDGQDAAARRSFEFKEFDANGTKRVPVKVKFANATEAERTVDLSSGQRVRVPVNVLPVDEPTVVLTDSAIAVLWASFSPDGRRLAVALENNAVILWDLTTGRTVRNFSGHFQAVQSVVFSPNGEWLLTSSMDTTAILWNVETGRLLRKFKGHSAAVNSAVFSSDGKKVLTGSTDKTAILWDAETGAQLRTFTGHTDEIVGVALNPDGRIAATASADKNAILWNSESGEKLFTLATRDTVSGIVFSPDGKLVAASNFSNNANVWDAATGKALGATARANLDLNSIAFMPNGRAFFTAGKDATVKLWDVNTRQMIREFTGHGSDIQSVAPSPDGRMLLTSSRDGTVRLFDVATGAELVSLANSNNGKTWAVVAPDGLYDGSESGRRMIGYRFSSKLPGAVVDQFFGQFYRPGLLADIFHGERPMAETQLGLRLPPTLKIVSPKAKSTDDGKVVVTVEAVDQGGGVAAPKIFNNGARLAIEPDSTKTGEVVRYSFPLNLAAGGNHIRVTAASQDGSWESMPAEIEINSLQRAERKGRLFVVAVGVGDSADARLNSKQAVSDGRTLADLLQRRSAPLYDRVDVIPLLGKDATRARIKDTLLDVASLSQPQDTVTLLVCGRGVMLDQHLLVAPQDLRLSASNWEKDFREQGLDVDELAALLGHARALNRVLMVDASDVGLARAAAEKPEGFALRAAVERWSRTQGLYAIAAHVPARPAAESAPGLLAGLLLDSAGAGPSSASAGAISSKGALGVMDWFDTAAERSGPVLKRLGLDAQVLQQSTNAKSFPLLVLAK